MKNLAMFILFLCVDCATVDNDEKRGHDALLNSGEVTQLAFTADGKNIAVANLFRFSFDLKREKCHGRLRSFSSADWKLTADTGELNVDELQCATSASGDWIVVGRSLDRFGRGNPLASGPVFYKCNIATMERNEIDAIQQGRENIYFVPSAIASASDKSLCAIWVERYPHGLPSVRLVFVFDLKTKKKDGCVGGCRGRTASR